MKEQKPETTHFFVDESGDPTFYDSQGNLIVGEFGCSSVLIIGFICTDVPQVLRRELLRLKTELATDGYLKEIPSLQKSLRAFHAKDDCPEVRQAVFKSIVELPFDAQFVVARKIEKVFTKSFGRNEKRFYDSLVSRLFQNVPHPQKMSHIYFEKRGSRKRQQPIEDAIRSGLERLEDSWNSKMAPQFSVQAQTPAGEPCLQIADYMNWAVYRVFSKQEMRYFDFVREKVTVVWDVYDLARYPHNYYTRDNPLDGKKISPL